MISKVAVALSCAVLVSVGSAHGGPTTPAATAAEGEAHDHEFTLAVLPDTQHLSRSFPDIFLAQTQWIAENRDPLNIAAVLHEGDVVGSYACQEQWDRASTAMGAIDGVVPYVVAGGNHDLIEYPADSCSAVTSSVYRGPSTLTATFPLTRSASLADGSGSYDGESDNSYLLLSAGGMDLVVLNLTFGPSDDVLAWAGQIAETYRDRTVIVVTHDYLGDDDQLRGGRSCDGCPPEHALPDGEGGTPMPWANTGQEMWDEFVKLHHNVRLVLNGHVSVCERRVGDVTERYSPCDWNVGFRQDTRPDGSSVWAMLANYQNAATGYMRLLSFDTATGDVEVTTYSPWLDTYLTGAEHGFSIPTAAEVRTFTDVGYSHPFFAEIEQAAAEGLINGHADGSFRPEAPVTREAAAAILWRAQPGDQAEGTCTTFGVPAPYSDVNPNSEFCFAIHSMSEAGLIGGWPDGTFRPTSFVSRQAFAAFMFGRGTYPGCAPFTDVTESNPFCAAIATAKDNGVTTGWPDGTFRPTLTINRDAAAVMALRYAALG